MNAEDKNAAGGELPPVDIAVVGAGPAGLSAAVSAASRGKTVRLLSGGASQLERAERVDNALGFPGRTGSALMRDYESHAAAWGVSVERGLVANILPFGGRFMLNVGLSGGRAVILDAGAVVLATGAVRSKPVPGEEALLGRGVSYCATCDGMLYRDKRAVVWGLAGDAAEEASFLSGIGVKVTYIAEGGRPPGLEADAFISGRVLAVTGEGRVSGVTTETGTTDADAVFVLREAIAPDALAAGLEMDNGFIRVNRMMETSIPGLFAAGDCTGRPLQVSKAVGEGLIAAQQAAKYLSDNAPAT